MSAVQASAVLRQEGFHISASEFFSSEPLSELINSAILTEEQLEVKPNMGQSPCRPERGRGLSPEGAQPRRGIRTQRGRGPKLEGVGEKGEGAQPRRGSAQKGVSPEAQRGG